MLDMMKCPGLGVRRVLSRNVSVLPILILANTIVAPLQ